MRYGVFSYNKESPKGGMFDMVDTSNSLPDAEISALSDFDNFDTIYVYDFLTEEILWINKK